MFRQAVIAIVSASTLLCAPTAAPSWGSVSSSISYRVAVPDKQVVRQYGDGPVVLQQDQRLVLRFTGRRGDRVRLGVVHRGSGDARSYGEATGVSVRSRTARAHPDAAGFFRLPASGWFSVVYDSQARRGKSEHVQLLKQVRVSHGAVGTTRLPRRRGFQYAVRLRVPQSGLEVVTFGMHLAGVRSHSEYVERGGQALVLAPGRTVLGDDDPRYPRPSDVLEPGQRIVALVDPAESGRVISVVPTDVGRVALDGAGVAMPSGIVPAAVAEIGAEDLAASAQRMLNIRLTGAEPTTDWNILVLPPSGGVAQPSAPAYGTDYAHPASLYRLADTSGTYRVLAFPSAAGTTAGHLELDSVVDGGTIAIDGPAVSVPAQPDGRFTLLGITRVEDFPSFHLAVSDVTVAAPWAVYAGALTFPRCPARGPLGCGEGNGVTLTSATTSDLPLYYGGYVLTMPMAGQTTGSFTVGLSH